MGSIDDAAEDGREVIREEFKADENSLDDSSDVEYVSEKDKSSKIANFSNPVVRTIGVGFDRFLGGFELTIKLAKHLEHVTRGELEEMIADMEPREICRFLNTDEALARGAVYQAAELSKSFKVFPFGVKELIIYPVQVKFLSKTVDGGLKEATRQVFSHKSYYPTSNMIVTFQSYTDDLEGTDLAQVSLQGLDTTVENNASCAECEIKVTQPNDN
ncbi:hypothetical protein KIN20_031441 [Parelaphostrongylus tenuis]|uniref:Hypoxia up-regulated protein 1 n=1 Tax=Parelaphostrongylus tenuis TaxID=148309 RepID=A0AAD5R5H8_PARTN|nr:hypothetical protein KIN20_031441 [Parelaphostrongylus tenuis]